jgi:hypothetical protein
MLVYLAGGSSVGSPIHIIEVAFQKYNLAFLRTVILKIKLFNPKTLTS